MPKTWPFAAHDDQEQTSGERRIEWSEQDIVLLHCMLLLEVRALADPGTPLDSKLDALRRVFAEPAQDACAFSSAGGLQLVASSPPSPIACRGRPDIQEIGDHLRQRVRRWLAATLERHPDWVREALRSHPERVEALLAHDPHAISRQLHQLQLQGERCA